MKRMLASIVLAVVLLSGCSVSINSKKDAETPSPSPANSEQAYLDNLHTILPDETSGVPDAQLVETGEAACSALDAGATFDEIATTVYQSGLDPTLAGGIVGAAVRDLCPEHQAALNSYLDSVG